MILFRWLFERLQRRFGGSGRPPSPSASPSASSSAPSGSATPSSASRGSASDQALTVGSRAMQLELANVATIARREYVTRGRTRAFRLATVLLAVAALGASLAPVLIEWASQSSESTKVEIEVGDTKPAVDPASTIAAILNADAGSPSATSGGSGTGTPAYSVTATSDEAGARARVDSGETAGLLILSRDPQTGLLGFTFVTKAKAVDRVSQFMVGAATDLAQADLLAKSVPPQTLALLGRTPAYATQLPNGQPSSTSAESFVNQFAAGFVLSIMLFIAIIVYGQWVALSVAEEKSSRVMEIILGAASPFELLAGKVIGVGGLALTQYVLIFIPAMLGIVFQGQIASLVLGGPPGSISLPAGLSPGMLVIFGIVFVLGFALYAVLYAGAASLISRSEDLQNIVAPMSLLASAGYLVAVYSTTGLISAGSRLVTIMTFIPFWSPVLVITRLGAGEIPPLEAVLALAILAVSVPIALRIAARLYSAGVLLYGQRPSIRLLARALRGT